jgi:hypothetical protein
MPLLRDGLDIAMRLDLKVQRAKKHIVDLESEWGIFLDTGPYRISVEDDFNTGERNYNVADAGEIPVDIPVIVGDALQNIRSALDHLAYHLAVLGSGSSGKLSHTYFPISDNATKYHSEKARKVKGMRQDAIDAIDALEPYGGGRGEIFWLINTLNNIDKHRILLTALPNLMGHSISPGQFRTEGWKRLFDVEPDRISDIMTAPAAKRFPLKFIISPAFAEPQVVEGSPIIPKLREMADVVHALIFRFENRGLLV